MRGKMIGSCVGIVAGLVFVLVNAGELPGPWSVASRLAGIAAAALSLAVVLRAPGGQSPQPSRQAVRTYGWSVAAMVVSIPVGAALLSGPLGAPELTVLWVVAVVGAHFLPFASAFEAPVFRPLALILITVAVLGVPFTLTWGKAAADTMAVVAGFALLWFAAQGARDEARAS